MPENSPASTPEPPDYLQRLTRGQANQLIHWVFDGHLPQRDASLEVIAAVFHMIGAAVSAGFALSMFDDRPAIVVCALAVIAGVLAHIASENLVAAFSARRDRPVADIVEEYFAPGPAS